MTTAEQPGPDPYATSTEPETPDEPGSSAAEPHAEGGGLVPPAGEVDPLPGSPYGTSTGLR